MINPGKIRHKGLKRYVAKGDVSKLRPDWLPKIRRILSALNTAEKPEDLDIPSYSWHQLEGNRLGTYSVKVNKNWRVTYRWDDVGPFDIDLEDYHGR